MWLLERKGQYYQSRRCPKHLYLCAIGFQSCMLDITDTVDPCQSKILRIAFVGCLEGGGTEWFFYCHGLTPRHPNPRRACAAAPGWWSCLSRAVSSLLSHSLPPSYTSLLSMSIVLSAFLLWPITLHLSGDPRHGGPWGCGETTWGKQKDFP